MVKHKIDYSTLNFKELIEAEPDFEYLFQMCIKLNYYSVEGMFYQLLHQTQLRRFAELGHFQYPSVIKLQKEGVPKTIGFTTLVSLITKLLAVHYGIENNKKYLYHEGKYKLILHNHQAYSRKTHTRREVITIAKKQEEATNIKHFHNQHINKEM